MGGAVSTASTVASVCSRKRGARQSIDPRVCSDQVKFVGLVSKVHFGNFSFSFEIKFKYTQKIR
jgi:hypothetical protein